MRVGITRSTDLWQPLGEKQMNKQTVTIKGRVYDVHTGRPVSVTTAHTPETPHPSHTVHQTTQKSRTLNRKTVKKSVNGISTHAKPVYRQDIAKSNTITKFAPHPSGAIKEVIKTADAAHTAHPTVAKANQRLAQSKTQQKVVAAPKPAAIIKQEAVSETLAKAPSHSAAAGQFKTTRRLPRLMSITTVSFALLLLAGYFTYINMPNLSVRVAAAQAGVNATYPSYHPDGYSLNGPVAYSQGQVAIKFASTTGPQSFTVSQSKSNWDSSALLDNYIKSKAGDNYITYDDHGLTIYTYGSNAAWVNGGILYTITGDAPLSSDQIQNIATSM